MKSLIILWVIALAQSAMASEKVLITGSSTMAPLISELSKAFEKNNSNFRFEVQTGGSSKGITDSRDQLNDIGMVSRTLLPEEKDLKATMVAQDGLAFIVHKSNTLKSLSSQQIVDIYKGTLTNWKQLGGLDQKIVVVSKAEGRAALEFFLGFFKLKNSEIKAAIIIGDEEQGVKTVSSTPGSIAFISVSSVAPAEKAGVAIRGMMVDGVKGDLENVRTGKYKLTRPLNLVTKGETEKTKKFLSFVASQEGQKLVEKLSYIPVR